MSLSVPAWGEEGIMLSIRRAGGVWVRRSRTPVVIPQRQMNLMPALRDVVKLDAVCARCACASLFRLASAIAACSLSDEFTVPADATAGARADRDGA